MIKVCSTDFFCTFLCLTFRLSSSSAYITYPTPRSSTAQGSVLCYPFVVALIIDNAAVSRSPTTSRHRHTKVRHDISSSADRYCGRFTFSFHTQVDIGRPSLLLITSSLVADDTRPKYDVMPPADGPRSSCGTQHHYSTTTRRLPFSKPLHSCSFPSNKKARHDINSSAKRRRGWL